MSRAFVKEEDGAPPPPPLERAISTAPNLVTPRGARLIDEEIATLERVIESFSNEDKAALARRDLRYWIARRASAQLVSTDPEPESAGFGTRIRIRRDGEESEIELVGEDEADPETGKIAWTSPLARALDGAEPGEIVELAAGGRLIAVELLAVRPGSR